MKLSDDARALIIRFEVGGDQNYYERFLEAPTWPKGASGVTIGVGYDLGYNSAEHVGKDWGASLGTAVVARLSACCGLTGIAARDKIGSVHDIRVPWQAALSVFEANTVARYWAMTAKAYPGADALKPNAQGALLSLVFNRGTSMKADDPKREEMRAIRPLVQSADYAGIAEQIKKMKRIWIGTEIEKGMGRRRDAEAALIMTCV
jgi:GH24 family phage-related lysozyme (muramidase)